MVKEKKTAKLGSGDSNSTATTSLVAPKGEVGTASHWDIPMMIL